MGTRFPTVLFAMVIICLLLSAGCVTPQQPADQAPAATTALPHELPVTMTRATSVPQVITTNPTPGPSATTQAVPLATTPVTTPAWIQKSTGKDTLNDPKILLLAFRKNYLPFDIPDCGMRTIFPAVTADPAYGLHVRDSKLVTIPDTDMNAFLRAYAGRYAGDPDILLHINPNDIGRSACTGVPANPEWNFIELNATLMPRNARPSDYDIGINILSQKTVITQIRINRSLEIDQPVFINQYIPLKKDEMEKFDDITLVFARRQ